MNFSDALFLSKIMQNRTIGYVSGVFDVLHPGHLKYLYACNSYCDFLFIGVDSNTRVESSKGEDRPFDDQDLRVGKLERAGFIAFVKFVSSQRYIGLLRPDVIFCPTSQSDKKQRILDWRPSSRIVLIADTPGISSTQIIQNIRKNAT